MAAFFINQIIAFVDVSHIYVIFDKVRFIDASADCYTYSRTSIKLMQHRKRARLNATFLACCDCVSRGCEK